MFHIYVIVYNICWIITFVSLPIIGSKSSQSLCCLIFLGGVCLSCCSCSFGLRAIACSHLHLPTPHPPCRLLWERTKQNEKISTPPPPPPSRLTYTDRASGSKAYSKEARLSVWYHQDAVRPSSKPFSDSPQSCANALLMWNPALKVIFNFARINTCPPLVCP